MSIKETNNIIDYKNNIILIYPKIRYLYSFYKYITIKEVFQYSKIESVKNILQAYFLLKKFKKRKDTFFIILKKQNKFVGTINLFYFNNFEYEIGISINPLFHRQKIAYNSINLLIDYAINYKMAKKFHFITFSHNYKAQNLATKLGFNLKKIYNFQNESYVHFEKDILEE